ncbi:cellulose biosynthesis protein BcsP [Cupriavidus pinatubonensis]|uniref:cellulose biosynthesis protein BcsP n=1 Tax=Cupriavidus pinatubonensis TaxID=248026 RepID=UPI003CC8B605
MSQSDDLSKLFSRFGGHSQTYREIVREDAAAESEQRWPLLASLRMDRSATIPPVQSLDIASPLPSTDREVSNSAPPSLHRRPEPVPVRLGTESADSSNQRFAGAGYLVASTAPGSSPLAQVFARLEGEAAPPAKPERTVTRRSFLERVKRS